MQGLRAVVVIPCYETEAYLPDCLRALEEQSTRDFRVLIVHKAISESAKSEVRCLAASSSLSISILQQEKGRVEEGINLALDQVDEEVLILLDSDAVPGAGFVKAHIERYSDSTLGGVSGLILERFVDLSHRISASEVDEVKLDDRREGPLTRSLKQFLSTLPATRGFARRMTISGYEYVDANGLTEGSEVVLGPGCNMSFRTSILSEFRVLPRSLYGLRFEAQIGLKLLADGFRVVYSERPRVLHRARSESLSRGFAPGKQVLLAVEATTFCLYLARMRYISHVSLSQSLESIAATTAFAFKRASVSSTVWAFVGATIGAIVARGMVSSGEVNIRKLEERLIRLFSVTEVGAAEERDQDA